LNICETSILILFIIIPGPNPPSSSIPIPSFHFKIYLHSFTTTITEKTTNIINTPLRFSPDWPRSLSTAPSQRTPSSLQNVPNSGATSGAPRSSGLVPIRIYLPHWVVLGPAWHRIRFSHPPGTYLLTGRLIIRSRPRPAHEFPPTFFHTEAQEPDH